MMLHLDRLQLLTVKSERLEKQLHLCAKGCKERLAHDEAAALDSSVEGGRLKAEVDPKANLGTCFNF